MDGHDGCVVGNGLVGDGLVVKDLVNTNKPLEAATLQPQFNG